MEQTKLSQASPPESNEVISKDATEGTPTLTPARDLIGLIPAGGQASRIAPLCCSKEIFPIGFQQTDGGQNLRPKPVCHYLIERMSFAGITKIFFVLRPGKWDIPTYLGDGSMLNVHLAYLMTRLPFGAPYTLDQAYPFVRGSLIAFGFPDIIFQLRDVFTVLADRQRTTGADLVLGLFRPDRPEAADMVDVGSDGWVRSLVIHPRQNTLQYAWIIAVWTPVFTQFMHDYLGFRGTTDSAQSLELSVGHVITASLDRGLRVHGVPFADSSYLDVGTPEDLVKAIRMYALP